MRFLPEQLGSKKDSSSFWHFSQSEGSVGMCIMGVSRGARVVLPSVRRSLAPSGGWVWISDSPCVMTALQVIRQENYKNTFTMSLFDWILNQIFFQVNISGVSFCDGKRIYGIVNMGLSDNDRASYVDILYVSHVIQ